MLEVTPLACRKSTDEAEQAPTVTLRDVVDSGEGGEVSERDVLTADDAAQLLRVSAKTVKRMAGEGKLPAQRVGRAWRFSRVAVLEWLAEGEKASA
jgi:excisionase family DNA binding protein